VGVEELVGDVGKDRARRGRCAFGYESEEAGEELPDVRAGGELGEFREEVGGEVFESLCAAGRRRRSGGVTEQRLVRVSRTANGNGDRRGEMAAAWMIGRAGFSGCEGHFLFLSLERGGHTRGTPSVETKRVRNGLIAKGLTSGRCGEECVRSWK